MGKGAFQKLRENGEDVDFHSYKDRLFPCERALIALLFLFRQINRVPFSQEITQLPSVLLRRTADLALAFAGIEAGSLVLQPFYFFGGGNIEIVVDGLGVLHAVVQQAGDLDTPASVLRLYLVFISDGDRFGGFGGVAVEFNPSFITGVGGLGPGFEKADGP